MIRKSRQKSARQVDVTQLQVDRCEYSGRSHEDENIRQATKNNIKTMSGKKISTLSNNAAKLAGTTGIRPARDTHPTQILPFFTYFCIGKKIKTDYKVVQYIYIYICLGMEIGNIHIRTYIVFKLKLRKMSDVRPFFLNFKFRFIGKTSAESHLRVQ